MSRRRKPWRAPEVGEVHFVTATFAGEGKFGVHKTQQYDIHGRRLWDPPGSGRPPNFDEAAASRLRDKLEPHARKRMAALGRRPYRDDPELLRIARMLVTREQLASSDKIICRLLIAPTLRKLRGPK
jgi:hypothetical protein